MAGKKAAKKVNSRAAKKVAKKAAKKGAKKAGAKAAGHKGNDVRRAYEHLHRVGVLHAALDRESLAHVDTLSRRAHAALAADDAGAAADLLRAAEHLAFGALAVRRAEPGPGSDLVSAAEIDYEHLTRKAREHWGQQDLGADDELALIFDAMQRTAGEAWEAGALHRALEFARGAEALSHVRAITPRLSASGRSRLRS